MFVRKSTLNAALAAKDQEIANLKNRAMHDEALIKAQTAELEKLRAARAKGNANILAHNAKRAAAKAKP